MILADDDDTGLVHDDAALPSDALDLPLGDDLGIAATDDALPPDDAALDEVDPLSPLSLDDPKIKSTIDGEDSLDTDEDDWTYLMGGDVDNT